LEMKRRSVKWIIRSFRPNPYHPRIGHHALFECLHIARSQPLYLWSE